MHQKKQHWYVFNFFGFHMNRTPTNQAAMLAKYAPNQRAFLRVKSVIQRTGLSRSSIYLMVKDGRFPAPLRISARMVAWREQDVLQWMDSVDPDYMQQAQQERGEA